MQYNLINMVYIKKLPNICTEGTTHTQKCVLISIVILGLIYIIFLKLAKNVKKSCFLILSIFIRFLYTYSDE